MNLIKWMNMIELLSMKSWNNKLFQLQKRELPQD